MKIAVKVKTRAKEERIEEISANQFNLWVKAPPVDNKANFAVLELIAAYFRVSLSSVRIVSGQTSTHKIIEII